MIYFAYGSTLNRDQLSELCPDADPLEPAKIPHHVLAFTGSSRRWGGGTATIRLATDRDVWGGIYEIDAACRRALEEMGAEEGYVWCWTGVESREGERTRAGVLVKVRDLTPSAPSDDYLEVLRAAWDQWDLDVTELEAAVRSTEQG